MARVVFTGRRTRARINANTGEGGGRGGGRIIARRDVSEKEEPFSLDARIVSAFPDSLSPFSKGWKRFEYPVKRTLWNTRQRAVRRSWRGPSALLIAGKKCFPSLVTSKQRTTPPPVSNAKALPLSVRSWWLSRRKERSRVSVSRRTNSWRQSAFWRREIRATCFLENDRFAWQKGADHF